MSRWRSRGYYFPHLNSLRALRDPVLLRVTSKLLWADREQGVGVLTASGPRALPLATPDRRRRKELPEGRGDSLSPPLSPQPPHPALGAAPSFLARRWPRPCVRPSLVPRDSGWAREGQVASSCVRPGPMLFRGTQGVPCVGPAAGGAECAGAPPGPLGARRGTRGPSRRCSASHTGPRGVRPPPPRPPDRGAGAARGAGPGRRKGCGPGRRGTARRIGEWTERPRPRVASGALNE